MKHIYNTLFNRIVNGVYGVDTWLREDSLAEEFHISRTPIREMLRQLEQDGLVQIIPKRGAKILPFTADDVDEIFEIRKSLELLALQIAAPSLCIDGLKDIHTRIQEIKYSEDSRRHTEIDASLHRYFIESSGRRRIISMLDNIFRLTQSFRELGFKDKEVRRLAAEEHLAFIDALLARDMENAKKILNEHLQNSKVRILSKIIKGD
jgi:DNA-binding GntR family transcriptional regulator